MDKVSFFRLFCHLSAQLRSQKTTAHRYPILDTRISVRMCVCVYVCVCVTLRGPPLDSETGWTGELWSNPVLLILQN